MPRTLRRQLRALAVPFLALLFIPAYALAIPQSPTVSYNFGEAAKYHAPISDFGILALDHAIPALTTSAPLLAANQATVSFSGSIQQNALRFVNDTSYMPQTETAVAVDPNNSAHIVGAFNDARMFYCPRLPSADCPTGYTQSLTGFTVSSDGGKSVLKGNNIPGLSVMELNQTNHMMFRGTLTSRGDPAVAAGVDGNFFVGSLAIDTNDSANGILLSESNAALWSNNVSCVTPLKQFTSNACWKTTLVFGNLMNSPVTFEDKELIAVDRNSQSPFYGSVYVSWDHFNSNFTSGIYLARCARDLGSCKMLAGDTLPPVSGSDPYAAFSQPVVARDGTVFVTWCNYGTRTTFGPITCKVRSFQSSSSTFGPPSIAASYMGNKTALPDATFVLGYATEQFRTASIANIAVDTSPKSSNLYFVTEVCDSSSSHFYVFLPNKLPVNFPTDNPGLCGQSQVLFSSSTNGGATWSAATVLSPPGVNSQPYVTVDSSNGDVYVLFYTNQFDEFKHRLDVVAERSTDGGSTFTELRLTSVSNEPNSDPTMYDYLFPNGFGGSFVVPQLGDYFQGVALNGKLYVLFTADYAAMLGTYQSDPFLLVGAATSFGGSLALQVQAESPVYGGQPVHINAIAQWSNGSLASTKFTVAQYVDPSGNLAQLGSPSTFQKGVYSWSVTLPASAPDGVYTIFLRANSTGVLAQGTGSFTVNSQIASTSGLNNLQNLLGSFQTNVANSLSKIQSSVNLMSGVLNTTLRDVSTSGAIVEKTLGNTDSILASERSFQYYLLAIAAFTAAVLVLELVLLRRRT